MRSRTEAAARTAPSVARWTFVAVLAVTLVVGPAAASVHSPGDWPRALHPYLGQISPGFQSWMSHHFEEYERAFIREDGRVVDPENAGVTHSEGQGYGMLLALVADDRATFDRVWRFARDELQRPDGLFSWRWDPRSTPHVTDRNNATDGDILIATALGLAAERWRIPEYRIQARRIAKAIGRNLIVYHDGRFVLMPGLEGFGKPYHAISAEGRAVLEIRESPIVNLSYWIYFAFPVLERLAPDFPWSNVYADGVGLTLAAGEKLSDWSIVAEHCGVCPAPRKSKEFGYNAIRIPLYMAMAGMRVSFFFETLLDVWGEPGRGRISTHLAPGLTPARPMNEPGYRFIHQYVWCLEHNEPIDFDLYDFRPTTYYASSLHLLAFTAVYAFNPECVPH